MIGNEILTGKVVDRNIPFLTKRFFELGVEVRSVMVVPDEVEAIAAAVRQASEACEFVVTTGGLGPTHDDVTVQAVARAFEKRIVHSPASEQILQKLYGFESGPQLTALCHIPEGSRLLHPEGARYPQLVVENVYVFPGMPDIVQRKFELICSGFAGEPFRSRQLQLVRPEKEIVTELNEAVAAFPDVRFGSYPQYLPDHEEVLITLDARDEALLDRALAFLHERLGVPV